jgi:hypothetical protein
MTPLKNLERNMQDKSINFDIQPLKYRKKYSRTLLLKI